MSCTSTNEVSFQDESRPDAKAGSSDSSSASLSPSDKTAAATSPGTTLTRNALLRNYRNKFIDMFQTFLSQYIAYIQSPARQEAILKTVQYTAWLLSRFYAKSNTKNKNNQLVAESLAKLSGELLWTRYVLRFFGLPAALQGAQTGNWAASKPLGKAMAWTMIGYYPLEHLAYLYWKAPDIHWIPLNNYPFGWKRRNSSTDVNDTCSATTTYSGPYLSSSHLASKASAWSCRFWFAYIVLDIARSVMALKEAQRNNNSMAVSKTKAQQNGEKNTQYSDSSNDHPDDPQQQLMIRSERLQIVRNILYALPALSWSLPDWDTNPWLSSDFVNGLFWAEAVVTMYQGIRNFQGA
jgi:hypothetical protein